MCERDVPSFNIVCFCFLVSNFNPGKPPTDGVIKEIEAYKASKEQTIVTMILSLGGIMFSFACLAVNIAYRKHRLVLSQSCLVPIVTNLIDKLYIQPI